MIGTVSLSDPDLQLLKRKKRHGMGIALIIFAVTFGSGFLFLIAHFVGEAPKYVTIIYTAGLLTFWTAIYYLLNWRAIRDLGQGYKYIVQTVVADKEAGSEIYQTEEQTEEERMHCFINAAGKWFYVNIEDFEKVTVGDPFFLHISPKTKTLLGFHFEFNYNEYYPIV